MNNKTKRIIISASIVLGVFVFVFGSIIFIVLYGESIDNRIKSYLVNYEKNSKVVMARFEKIFFSDRTVDLKELYPEQTSSRLLYVDNENVYFAISKHWNSKGCMVSIYETDPVLNDTKKITERSFEKSVSLDKIYMFDKEKIFFLTEKDNYFIYNISTEETSHLSAEYNDYKPDEIKREFIGDDELYSLAEKGNTVTITNKETGVNKAFNKNDLIDDITEIKNDITYEKILCNKNDVYVVCKSYTDSYAIIFKLDFDNETLTLFAWNYVFDIDMIDIFFLN